jgi:hypothetical protein
LEPVRFVLALAQLRCAHSGKVDVYYSNLPIKAALSQPVPLLLNDFTNPRIVARGIYRLSAGDAWSCRWVLP